MSAVLQQNALIPITRDLRKTRFFHFILESSIIYPPELSTEWFLLSFSSLSNSDFTLLAGKIKLSILFD